MDMIEEIPLQAWPLKPFGRSVRGHEQGRLGLPVQNLH